MNTAKPWYQSKTIIVSVLGAIFGVLIALGKLPAGFDSDELIGAVVVVTAGLAAIFRSGATAEIKS